MEFAFPKLSAGQPERVLIIAELSANHNGSLEQARALVQAAAEAGADAIKVQTYTADSLTLPSERPEFRIQQGTLWDGRTLHDLYREAALPYAWHAPLQEAAEAAGVPFFSAPFDPAAVDFLVELGVPALKIASPEIVDRGLIEACAATGKPLILSTGMARLEEIEAAVGWARAAGCGELALLKCTAAYPAQPEEMNLRTLPMLAERFGAPVGLSDHTFGHTAAVAAVALGARIIEKHLCLDRSLGGPDSGFSLEPGEFAAMVQAVRETEAALGDGQWRLCEREEKNRVFQRSLYLTRDVKAGEVLSPDNVRSVRPALGLPPALLPDLQGRRFTRDLPAHTPLEASMLETP